jgi:KDO2-lipid IV(A) lauroyltransferase
MRRIKFTLEYLLVISFLAIIRRVPLRMASGFGGWFARSIGVRMRRSTLAESQLRTHLPQLTDTERRDVMVAMWDNLGRVIAEYPHLMAGHLDTHIEIIGREHVDAVIASGKSALFISGHFGNWELAPKTIQLCGLPLHLVYRPPNNPLTDRIIDRIRRSYTLGHYGKGAEGAKGVLAAIRRHESIGILIDQKDNTGVAVPFLGAPAMTSPSPAKLALKYGLPVIPVRAERISGHHFRVTIYPPLAVPEPQADAQQREITYLTQMNAVISGWIEEAPAQWFWLHRRWPKLVKIG